jgi:hypothetical protein
MKKPEGKAEAGWYDAPEIEGYLQYWNGRFWTKEKQIKDGFENLEVLPEKQLGKFLFRSPIMNDGIFIAYLVLAGISALYLIADYRDFTSGITTIILIIPAIGITLIWIYIIFLLVLIPRRLLDKKNGITKSVSDRHQFADINSDSVVSEPMSKNRKKYLVVIVFLLLLFLIYTAQSKSGFERDADAFFNKQKEISLVLNDWNKESALLFGVIQKVSNGELDYPSAIYALNESNSRIGPVIESLRDECIDVPVQTINQTGEAQAIALAWNMLKVTCDLVPLQRIEYLAIFDAQWSESATQSKIDYHVERLADLAQKRKDAVTKALVEFEKYATGSQLEQIQQLNKLLE